MSSKTELSDKKRQEFLEAFSLFDKDGDKKISEEELASVYRDLGGAPSSAQIKSMIREVSNSSDENLSMNQEEFIDFMKKQMEAASDEAQIIEAFRVMSDDVDKSGKVKISELKNILTRVGQKFSEEEAQMLINDAKQDTDDDTIDYISFVHRMMSRP